MNLQVLKRFLSRTFLWSLIITMVGNSYTYGSQGQGGKVYLQQMQSSGLFKTNNTLESFYSLNQKQMSESEKALFESLRAGVGGAQKMPRVTVKQSGQGNKENIEFLISEGRTTLAMNLRFEEDRKPYFIVGKTRLEVDDVTKPDVWFKKIAQGFQEQTGQKLEQRGVQALVEAATPQANNQVVGSNRNPASTPVAAKREPFRFMTPKEMALLSPEQRKKYLVASMKLIAAAERDFNREQAKKGASREAVREEFYAWFYDLILPRAVAQARGQACFVAGWEGTFSPVSGGRLSCVPSAEGNSGCGSGFFQCNPQVYGNFGSQDSNQVGAQGGICVSRNANARPRGMDVSDTCGFKFEERVANLDKAGFESFFQRFVGGDSNCFWGDRVQGATGRAQCSGRGALLTRLESIRDRCTAASNVSNFQDQKDTCRDLGLFTSYVGSICTQTYRDTGSDPRSLGQRGADSSISKSSYCQSQSANPEEDEVAPGPRPVKPVICVGKNQIPNDDKTKCICRDGSPIKEGKNAKECASSGVNPPPACPQGSKPHESIENLCSCDSAPGVNVTRDGETQCPSLQRRECAPGTSLASGLTADGGASRPTAQCMCRTSADNVTPKQFEEPVLDGDKVICPERTLPPPHPVKPCPQGQVPRSFGSGSGAGEICMCPVPLSREGAPQEVIFVAPDAGGVCPVLPAPPTPQPPQPPPGPVLPPNCQPRSGWQGPALQDQVQCLRGQIVTNQEICWVDGRHSGFVHYMCGESNRGSDRDRETSRRSRRSGFNWGDFFKWSLLTVATLGIGYLVYRAYRPVRPPVQNPAPPIPLPNDTALPVNGTDTLVPRP